MTTLHDVAHSAAKRTHTDPKTTFKHAKEITRQLQDDSGVKINEDDLTDEQAAFILGALTTHGRIPPSVELDAIAARSKELDAIESKARAAREARDRAILAASNAGQKQDHIKTVSGLSLSAIRKILRTLRNVQGED